MARKHLVALTCKYWGAEIFWSGLMTVAMGGRRVVRNNGPDWFVWLKMPSLFYADEAVAAVAMVLILRKVSINQSMRQAIQITMTTKTFWSWWDQCSPPFCSR